MSITHSYSLIHRWNAHSSVSSYFRLSKLYSACMQVIELPKHCIYTYSVPNFRHFTHVSLQLQLCCAFRFNDIGKSLVIVQSVMQMHSASFDSMTHTYENTIGIVLYQSIMIPTHKCTWCLLPRVLTCSAWTVKDTNTTDRGVLKCTQS